MAGYQGGGGGGAGAAPSLTWSFPGTISTDQNPNIPRYQFKVASSFGNWDVKSVSAPSGGDMTVTFKKNGATIATVVLLDGDTYATVAAAVSFAVDDVLYPEISSLGGASSPPTTLLMRARA